MHSGNQSNFRDHDRHQKLDRGPHSIAVRVVVHGEERLLRGQGTYEQDGDLGAVLRVSLPSTAGCEELLLLDDAWRGKTESGAALGCDFLIHLN